MTRLLGQHWIGLAAAVGLLAVAPVPALATGCVAAGLWLATRQGGQSIAIAALMFPLAVWLIDHPGVLTMALAVALAAILFWRYRADLRSEPGEK